MSELKPCPFCGGEAKIGRFMALHTVGCKECLAMMVSEFLDKTWSKEKAVEAWNRRVEDEKVLCGKK